ncbi:MAG: hypothetical protein WD602_10470 [Actinomycetota bacterium]
MRRRHMLMVMLTCMVSLLMGCRSDNPVLEGGPSPGPTSEVAE